MASQNTKPEISHDPKIVVGLDIGTAKVCALVAAKDELHPDSIKILGVGTAVSEGLNRGVVVNIEKTVQSIQKAVEQAEQQSGKKITEVVVGIAGDHIESFSKRGVIGISHPNHEISDDDVERVINESRNFKIATDRNILHIIPQDFIIDGQDGIVDPVGMSGVRMEANVHIVTGLDTAIQNIYRCIERLNIRVKNIILEPLASSYAVLAEEEKEVGVALVDIGGGTTDIAVFDDNVIRFTSVFGIGGRQVTEDISKGISITTSQAERIKKENGHAYAPTIMDDNFFTIPGIAGRKALEVNKSMLSQIIQPRMEEIFDYALAEIRRSGYSGRLGAGVVLTGGTSLLMGVEELAQERFGMPVKIGFPSSVTYTGLAPEIQTPIYSTAVGLAMFALKDIDDAENAHQTGVPEFETENGSMTSKDGIFSKIKNILTKL